MEPRERSQAPWSSLARRRRGVSLTLGDTFVQLLRVDVCVTVTDEALTALRDLFAEPRASDAQMAVRSAGALAAPDEIARSCAALASDLLAAVTRARDRK